MPLVFRANDPVAGARTQLSAKAFAGLSPAGGPRPAVRDSAQCDMMRNRSSLAGGSSPAQPCPSLQGACVAVKRPSFLKKLKEQQRRARADEKREARRA